MSTSHVNIVTSEESVAAKTRNEGRPFVNENPSRSEWNGPDVGYLRNREALQKRTNAFADALGAKARELGRPLTDLERTAIAKEFGI